MMLQCASAKGILLPSSNVGKSRFALCEPMRVALVAFLDHGRIERGMRRSQHSAANGGARRSGSLAAVGLNLGPCLWVPECERDSGQCNKCEGGVRRWTMECDVQDQIVKGHLGSADMHGMWDSCPMRSQVSADATRLRLGSL